MKFATLAFSAIACVSSVATLAVVYVGAKKLESEMSEMKQKTNAKLNKFKAALAVIQDLDS